jgi:hypothetical protein
MLLYILLIILFGVTVGNPFVEEVELPDSSIVDDFEYTIYDEDDSEYDDFDFYFDDAESYSDDKQDIYDSVNYTEYNDNIVEIVQDSIYTKNSSTVHDANGNEISKDDIEFCNVLYNDYDDNSYNVDYGFKTVINISNGYMETSDSDGCLVGRLPIMYKESDMLYDIDEEDFAPEFSWVGSQYYFNNVGDTINYFMSYDNKIIKYSDGGYPEGGTAGTTFLITDGNNAIIDGDVQVSYNGIQYIIVTGFQGDVGPYHKKYGDYTTNEIHNSYYTIFINDEQLMSSIDINADYTRMTEVTDGLLDGYIFKKDWVLNNPEEALRLTNSVIRSDYIRTNAIMDYSLDRNITIPYYDWRVDEYGLSRYDIDKVSITYNDSKLELGGNIKEVFESDGWSFSDNNYFGESMLTNKEYKSTAILLMKNDISYMNEDDIETCNEQYGLAIDTTEYCDTYGKYTEPDISINGITFGDTYDNIKSVFGEATKIEEYESGTSYVYAIGYIVISFETFKDYDNKIGYILIYDNSAEEY